MWSERRRESEPIKFILEMKKICDVEETLTERGIPFTREAGDIYVAAPVKTCDKKCSSCSQKYPMTRLEKQVQLDCRLTSCRFYQGAGVCNNVCHYIK